MEKRKEIINSENWDDCTLVSNELKLGVKEGRQKEREEIIKKCK